MLTNELICRCPTFKLRLLLIQSHFEIPLILIQCVNLCHVISRYFNIKNIQVIMHVLRVRGFWKNNVARLYVQPQNDWGG